MKSQRKHVNTLNLRTIFEMISRGVTLPPGVQDMLRRMKHRAERLARYRFRNASYPYSGKRQTARYTRQRADARQMNSHKPPAIWPNHLGPNPWRTSAQAVA